MVPSHDKDDGTPVTGGAAGVPDPHTYTVYECVYPDASRRRAGEPADEAVSRAFFELREDAERFRSHNGGEVRETAVSSVQLRQLKQQHKLPSYGRWRSRGQK